MVNLLICCHAEKMLCAFDKKSGARIIFTGYCIYTFYYGNCDLPALNSSSASKWYADFACRNEKTPSVRICLTEGVFLKELFCLCRVFDDLQYPGCCCIEIFFDDKFFGRMGFLHTYAKYGTRYAVVIVVVGVAAAAGPGDLDI